MQKKTYDIVLDSDGWTCRSHGEVLGSFPSWLLAVGAVRVAAQRDMKNGATPVVRYQDLKGAMHVLDLDTGNDAPLPQHPDRANIVHLARGERAH